MADHTLIGFLLATLLAAGAAVYDASAAPIGSLVDINGGYPIVRNNGSIIDLVLDQKSASGFQSKQQFLLAQIDCQIKLPPTDSAGVVATFYMSSTGSAHDEIDLEFLGNVSGQPLVLHTNVYAKGIGNKEMQFYLSFDPRAAYHTYSIVWGSQFIIIYVDGTPIRAFPNLSVKSIPYPTSQQMRVYASIWDGDSWATQGGRIKINWANAPFIASFTNLKASPCPSSNTACKKPPTKGTPVLDSKIRASIQGYQKKFMIYNYCADKGRFPNGLPPECSVKI